MDEAHRPWDELAAGLALHALEPADEARLLAHAAGCRSCQRHLDEFNLVAAQLAFLADDVEVAPLRRRRPRSRRRHVRLLATAAGFVLLAAGGVAGWQLGGRPDASMSAAAVAACQQRDGCHVITLHGPRRDAAVVLVEAGHASVVPLQMPMLRPTQSFVLWQLPRDGSPLAVAAFRDARRQSGSVRLMTAYDDTAAFAVSLEAAGPMPRRPTRVLAVGASNA